VVRAERENRAAGIGRESAMMDDAMLLPSGVELEHDDATGCYRVRYDATDAPPSAVAVGAVAAIAGTDPLDLDPVWDSVDPDALDDLFRSTPGGRLRESGQIVFSLADHRVAVDADDEMEIWPPDAVPSGDLR
jgi:hypothetical protein